MKKLTKKLVMVAVALLAATTLSAATIHEGDAAQKSFTLSANKQYGDNYESQGSVGNILPKDYVAKAGDKITISVEATVDKDIILGERNGKSSSVEMFFCDCSPKANYWAELTDRVTIKEAVKAGDKIVWNFTFEIKKDAQVKAGSTGCRLVFSSSPQQTTAVTIKTTKFTFKIDR